MRAIPVLLASALTAAPAFAQAPRFPVPLNATEGYGACSTARIMNIAGRGAYASVRSGPSSRQRELGRLPIGRDVYACVRHGNWFGILYERRPGERRCARVLEPQRRTTNYRGPCGSGWVHYNYLGGYADFISP
ncbi:MAG TPA: hypothetical protein VEC11_09210 [Allosphingosinicella sp.]|nr:hypothetical protein [Allosphingosinicella sp.]